MVVLTIDLSKNKKTTAVNQNVYFLSYVNKKKSIFSFFTKNSYRSYGDVWIRISEKFKLCKYKFGFIESINLVSGSRFFDLRIFF